MLYCPLLWCFREKFSTISRVFDDVSAIFHTLDSIDRDWPANIDCQKWRSSSIRLQQARPLISPIFCFGASTARVHLLFFCSTDLFFSHSKPSGFRWRSLISSRWTAGTPSFRKKKMRKKTVNEDLGRCRFWCPTRWKTECRVPHSPFFFLMNGGHPIFGHFPRRQSLFTCGRHSAWENPFWQQQDPVHRVHFNLWWTITDKKNPKKSEKIRLAWRYCCRRKRKPGKTR